MVSNFRQKEILELARKEGKVTVDDLAERYDVTVQTIRRDLSDLADSGRVHWDRDSRSWMICVWMQLT